MEIRRKLSYQFILIVALILLLSFISIYISVSSFRKETFYARLESRALSVAQLLIDVDEINAELLRKIEKSSSSGLPYEQISIFDYHNELIYTSDEKNGIIFDTAQINEVRLKNELRIKERNFEILGLFYKSKYDRFVVFIGARDVFGLEKLSNLRLILLIVFFISLIIVLFAGLFYSDRALSPIIKVMGQVDKIGVSNLNQRVDEGNGKDEIARLASTFNEMLERIESAFKVQKNFISNASHELRTPLTIITGQLEIVLLNEREPQEYKTVIQSVLEDIRNLNKISDRLLMLAQTSSEVAKINFSAVRVDDLLWLVTNEIVKRKPAYKVSITLNEDLDDENMLTISGNEQLLKTAFSNLIENACKYSPAEKKVVVALKNDSESLQISFKDNGIGIPDEDIEMIFQPFYRGRNSLEYSGSGIGLSLAERIVKIHSGQLKVNSKMGEGSEFILIFPLLHPSKL